MTDTIKISFNPVPVKLFKTKFINDIIPQSGSYQPKIRSESKLFGLSDTSIESSIYKPGQRNLSIGPTPTPTPNSNSNKKSKPEPVLDFNSSPSSLMYRIHSDLYNGSLAKSEDRPFVTNIRELIVEVGKRFYTGISPQIKGSVDPIDSIDPIDPNKFKPRFEKVYLEWIHKMNLILQLVENLEIDHRKHTYLGLKEILSLQIMNISMSMIVFDPSSIWGMGFNDYMGRNSKKFVSSLVPIYTNNKELLCLVTLLQLIRLFQSNKDISYPTQSILDRLLDVGSDEYISDIIRSSLKGTNIMSELNDLNTLISDITYTKLLKNTRIDIQKILYKSNITSPINPTQILSLGTYQLREIKKNLLATYHIAEKIDMFVNCFTSSIHDIHHYQTLIKRKEFTHTSLLNEQERLESKLQVLKININKLTKIKTPTVSETEELSHSKKTFEITKTLVDSIPLKITNIIEIIDEYEHKINIVLFMIFDIIDFSYFTHVDYFPMLDWGLLSGVFFGIPSATNIVR